MSEGKSSTLTVRMSRWDSTETSARHTGAAIRNFRSRAPGEKRTFMARIQQICKGDFKKVALGLNFLRFGLPSGKYLQAIKGF
jgi:hypothetical protein